MSINDEIRKNTGKTGEDYTANYLESKGFKIIKRNYHSRYGEIDIIASNSKFILFTEVKTRHENPMYPPCEAVTYQKQRKIIKTAVKFLIDNKYDLQPRFDVAEVILKRNSYEIISINYIENAFIQEEGYAPF